MARTPPPEEFYPPPDDGGFKLLKNCTIYNLPSEFLIHKLFFAEPSISTSNESVSPRPEPGNGKFRFVTSRKHHHAKGPSSPRRGSVPNFAPGQPTQQNHHLNVNTSAVLSARSASPEYLSSRQSSLSDDSCGPYSSRSTDTNRSSCGESLYSAPQTNK